MIWILHYIIFNSGLSAILILLTLFLQTYSKASMSEIGALLMVLPFLAVFIKPIFCALADRQRAHRYYLIGALMFMALGYGSLIVVPCFFPQLIETHPNLVWYCDVCSIVVGFSAFGLTWSLGDALSVEAARQRNIPWGTYRVWGTISWGVFGVIIGQINEVPILPKFVPAFIVLIISAFLEALLMAVWSKEAFEPALAAPPDAKTTDQADPLTQTTGLAGDKSADASALKQDLERGMSTDSFLRESVRGLDRRLVANVLMQDLGETLKSSLKLSSSSNRRRAGLDSIINQAHQEHIARNTPPPSPQLPPHLASNRSIGSGSLASRTGKAGSRPSPMIAAAVANALAHKVETGSIDPPTKVPPSPEMQRPPTSQQQQQQQSAVTGSGSISRAASLGKSALQRTLARMNSLGAASGNAIADEILVAKDGSSFNLNDTFGKHQQVVMMSSLASGASLSRAAAARAMGFSGISGGGGSSAANESASNETADKTQKGTSFDGCELSMVSQQTGRSAAENKDLQMVLLKLIIRRDASIWKLLFVFTFFGALMTAHITYFFVHVAKLCDQHAVTFSSVTGVMLASHSLSEIFSFLVVVPYYVTRVGHIGAFATCGLIHAIRFFYYGTLYATHSPYMGLISEISHGIIYGVVYSLITDVANDCVNRVDAFLPELIERGIVEPDINPSELKLPLRATMQGVFSGAFDGLGNGIGALAGGVYLDYYSFNELWMFCGYSAVVIALFYPLTEWRQVLAAFGANKAPDPSSNSSSFDAATLELTNGIKMKTTKQDTC